MLLIKTKSEDKIFLEDLDYKNQYKKVFHYQHLIDFLNNYDNNIDVLSILKDFNSGNHYELFFRGPVAMSLYSNYSKTELTYNGLLGNVKELEVYEFEVDQTDSSFLLGDGERVIALNNRIEENVNHIRGFFFNNIFYVSLLLIIKEEDTEENE